MAVKTEPFLLERTVYVGIALIIPSYSIYKLFISSKSPVNLNLLRLKNVSLTQNLVLMQDAAEFQWTLLPLWMSFVPYLLLYSIVSSFVFALVNKKIFKCCRIILSIWLINYLVGYKILMDVFLNILCFSCISYLVSGNWLLIWAFAVLVFQASESFESSFNFGLISYDWYMILYAAHFYIVLRSLSVALSFHKCSNNFKSSFVKKTEKEESIINCAPKSSLESLLDALDYSLYPHSLLLGPLVLYSNWVNFWENLDSLHSNHLSPSFRTLLDTLISLVSKAIRLIFWSSFWSLCLCIVYPNSFGYLISYAQISELSIQNKSNQYYLIIDRGTVGASIYLRSLHLFIIYLQFYGWPYVLSNFECLLINLLQKLLNILQSCGRNTKATTTVTDQTRKSHSDPSLIQVSFMPEPPACLLHFLLISECWRSFDRGLYNFIKSYIFIPVMKFNLPSNYKHSLLLIPFPIIKNWLALTLSYSFVLLYHGIDKTNAIWLSTNLLLLFSERSVKWIYRCTNLGSEIRHQLSDRWIRRLSLLLCATSGIFSVLGNLHFLFGSKVANQLAVWLIYDPTLRFTVFVYFYCQMNFVTDLRSLFPSIRPHFEKKIQ
ncbi:hypothetical protein MS3_00006150 [Schistosoma haematobium]|uniref:Uncharacterized protein n=2 Tax=Schistosoma haematobium TaxID=6185 RepID=A0A922LUZ8_SCHHA|nr:hypothetical protein MS3_00006150 [Schistosoma haematobium]KAH9594445.1 hypothetical protein MS3_00006150 [Schistosoma haematobium]CAH8444823.1 unnamed protein product [Schistosoma haematobium]CAH8445013.1 unnamed protein product [Schistosoma haematobium]